MKEKQKVWVVYEEDRGWGTTIIGVYTELNMAEEVRGESSHRFIDSVILNEK